MMQNDGRIAMAAATNDGSGSDNEANIHVSHEVVILAPCILLALGAFLRHTTKSLPLPYTMQLLIVGAVLGFLLREDWWDGALKQSIEGLANMDPHLMLHIFLPPLIFESAASLEWHLFTRAKSYIFALAGPGLIVASYLTGSMLNLLLQRSDAFDECLDGGWTTQAGFMLGVILSATDPVAVVALLKEMGCKATLSTAIEGESLLNDATALVMFTILVSMVQGDPSLEFGEYIWTFVKMSLGGALFGVAFAIMVVKWLGVIFNDALSEITITLSAAYLCFFIAEYFFHVSGVLAVVCLGLYFGQHGKTSVSPEVAHFLEEFWEMLAYFGNTLIFIVGGIVIGFKLPLFPASAYWRLVIMYGACTLIRAAVIGTVYLIFRQFGSNIEFKDQVVATWGGLRGAVGLSLAMMVFGNSSICQPIRDEVIFQTAGIIVFTVCINSLTMPQLVKLLGMDEIAPSKRVLFEQAMGTLINAGEKQESNIRADNIFASTVWEEARKFYLKVPEVKISKRMFNSKIFDEIQAAKEARRRVLTVVKKSYWRQFQDGLLSNQTVKYLIHCTDLAIDDNCSLNEWQTYVDWVKLNVQRDDKISGERDSLSPNELRRLRVLSVVDSVPMISFIVILAIISCVLAWVLDPESTSSVVVEHTTTVLFFLELSARFYCKGNWHSFVADPYIIVDTAVVLLDVLILSAGNILGSFSSYTKSIRTIRFLRLIRLLRIARVANKIKNAKVEAINNPTSLWEKAEGWANKYKQRILFDRLKHGYEIATGFKVAREEVLAAFSLIHSKDHNRFADIRKGLERDMQLARVALLDMQRLYSEIAASITTSVAARTVLNRQRHAIQDLFHEGLLEMNEYKRLTASVEFSMKKLVSRPPLIKMPSKWSILGQIPWLENLSSDALQAVTDSFEDALFQRGDVLVKQGESSDVVHVLARGTVAVVLETESGDKVEIDQLGLGSVFGEIAWALKCNRGASIVATSPGLYFTIPGQKLRHLAETDNQLETKLWQVCGTRLAENLLAAHLEQRGHSRRTVRETVHAMTLYSIDPLNKIVCFNTSGYIVLLRGRAVVDDEKSGKSKAFDAPQVLEATETPCGMDFSTDAKFMCDRKTIAGFADEINTDPIHTATLEYARPGGVSFSHDELLRESSPPETKRKSMCPPPTAVDRDDAIPLGGGSQSRSTRILTPTSSPVVKPKESIMAEQNV